MHDLEKSDSAILAVKPPNKAGPPVAEVVEPRAGAKGKADQQSTQRTQCVSAPKRNPTHKLAQDIDWL